MMRLVLVSVVLLLGACAQWAKPGGTAEALSADQAACQNSAALDYPPTLAFSVDPGDGLTQPGYACIPNRGCVPTGGTYVPPGASVSDKNAAPRTAAFDRCMTGRGWTR